MGDSITALNTETRGWVGYFNQIIRPSHFVNVAVCGASLEDKEGTVYDGKPVFVESDPEQLGNVVGNQVERVALAVAAGEPDFEGFDIIMIAAGTNRGHRISTDDIAKTEAQFITSGGKALSLEECDRTTWAGAMRYIYEKLRGLYPMAKIFFCSPVQADEKVRPYASIEAKGRVMKAVCDRISDVIFVNTFNCGICGIYEKWGENGRDLIDGLHPNVSGANKIARYNARAVIEEFLV